jgi:NitT/TauT family transport system substrate-binding protein
MKIRLFLKLFILFQFCISILLSQTNLKKASFVPLWTTQAQFAGYYVAYELGFYKKHGIDLTIIPGGQNSQSSDLIKNGKADFGLLWLAIGIQMRDNGVPIVNIAQLSHKSSVLLIAKKSSGIITPADMDDQKIAVWSGPFLNIPKPFFKKYNISPKVIPIGSTNNLFLLGGADITIANWFDEYHTIISSGFDTNELRVFPFSEYGLNFPEDGIYCLESTYKKDPKLCSDFVKGSIEGWQYAFDHMNETLDIIMKYVKLYKVTTNRVHQRWMLARMKDLFLSNGGNITNTILSKSEYELTGNSLKENKIIKEIPKYELFFRFSNIK